MATAREKYPDIYVERNENPRERRRTVPLEVLSLGYSRTGTMSMSLYTRSQESRLIASQR